MKRSLILAAMAIVAVTACSKTEATYQGEDSEITFQSNLSPLTKTTTALDVNANMGVFAVKDVPEKTEFFGNTEFVYKNNMWTADPAKLYPRKEGLIFTVYSPFENQTLQISNGKIVYNVPEKVDFLYGANTYKGDKNSNAVDINLKHAKSMVAFTVSSDAVGVYNVTSITLKDAYKVGELTVTYDPSLVAKWEKVEKGDIVLQQNVSLAPQAAPYGDACYVVPCDIDNTPSRVIRKQSKIIVNYTMNGVACDPSEYIIDKEWIAGRKYTFNIKFESDVIKFNPTVEDWVAEPDVTINPLPVE